MNPDSARLLDCADRIEADLRTNLLPFWLKHAPGGPAGFIGALSDDLVPRPAADRGLLLSARILWTFAAVHQRYPSLEHKAMARRAHDDLLNRFHDPVHGGYWWALKADGSVSQDRKQTYGQAFALFALAEYHAAFGEARALQASVAIFELLEQHARDERHGGYVEALDRAWRPLADMRLSAIDLNTPKSQNTHLHLLEAYAALLRVWPDPRLRAALAGLIELMLTRIADPVTGRLRLFFSDDWVPASDTVSYGHDIEAVWLMARAHRALHSREPDARLGGWMARVAEATLAAGLDRDGGVFYQGGPAGVTDRKKEWWAQAEAVVGFLEAAQLTGDPRHLAAALRVWDFIETRLIDHAHGEWRWGLAADGSPLMEDKIGVWKCPYHNGRAALEATHRLRALAHLPP